MHLCWVLAHTWASKHKQKVPLLVPHVGPLCCSLQAVRFCPVLAVEAESRAKDEVVSACSSAVTVFDKVLVISEAEWGSLVEEGEDRWGRVSCSMGSGVSPSPHLPSASSFQTCKGRFFSWFYLDTTYIDGDFSSPLRSRSQELLNIWSTFQYHQVIESIQNLLNVKAVGASLDYGLKLLWADTQNLSRASPTYRVILDLWLMRFDNKLVLK